MIENNNREDNQYFGDLVGLDNTKRRLSFYINNFHSSGIMPNILLTGSKGTGKTSLVRLVAGGMNRTLVETNAAELKSLDDFFGVVNQYVVGSKVLLFIDEIENLNIDIAIAFLTILEPKKDNITKYTHAGQDYIFNFKDFSVAFCTTEAQTVHHALLDRLRVIDMDDYTTDNLKQIIRNNLSKYDIEDGLLDRVVKVVRSNPRQAQILSNDLLAFLSRSNTNTFSSKEWIGFYREMGLFELGLSGNEIKLLKILKKYPNSSLTRVASMLNATPDATRKYTELYPMKMGLIEVKPALGRRLTVDGHKYMELIKE
jgi:Holliday junction resolvasome RuvABC ATP-dependent DNA helicase subunit